ncbi:hypothetical protein SSX86_024630 [Deinandra increscens subsp. villosa]|uniref:HAT C-terminal dimerisation domain-containing protein n=1 Tax=Deinandra increscens subsp. villosa TaxID=3103831 RepID=A0AAP0CCR0_9ASTR
MRHFTKKADIVRPGVTRFASSFLTLQSLFTQKVQLKNMFSSSEWDTCKLSDTAKGKAAYNTVMNLAFWDGVKLCIDIFDPLVKVLRMVDADWKPSMGFIYGEMQSAIKEIKNVLKNNKKDYQPILDIISTKMKDRLDTKLHLTAYLLNPYYFYNNTELKDDMDLVDAFVDFLSKIYEDHELQNHILMVELPVYRDKLEKFSRELAIKACKVNDDKFDPANWWGAYGASTPLLRKIAIRILSLTTSSSGCERNWSTFEAVHTKKRNRLEAAKLNNLVFVQFNANLMIKNKKRKTRGIEVLRASEATEAQDWIVEGHEGTTIIDESGGPTPSQTVSEAIDAESLENRRGARPRELDEEDFVSENEEELNVEVQYESDGDRINEEYGDAMEEDN